MATKPTPSRQELSSEAFQKEIAADSDMVRRILGDAVQEVVDGRYALGAALGLMRLACGLIYHADKADVSDAASLAMSAMRKVREDHGDSEFDLDGDSPTEETQGAFTVAEDSPLTVDDVLTGVPGSELLDLDTFSYNFDMSLAVVFDEVPVTFALNVDGSPLMLVATEVESAGFDVGFNPLSGKPQIAWAEKVPTSHTIKRATDVMVALVFALYQSGNLFPFFRKENA